ncbi:MAG: hypothetical protein JNJ64_12685 [Flavobacteriales bacterium]|nr:hypothetical protein [Flavobacteriales bacterium]
MSALTGALMSLRWSFLGCALACSLLGHAQVVVQAEAVIAPLQPQAAVKPMLGAVVDWLPHTEVHYDRPERTLHFSGPVTIQPTELAHLLNVHGFQLIHWSGSGSPGTVRTTIAPPDPNSPHWTPLDADAVTKNAWIAADPARYLDLLHRATRTDE